jgi:hypothetical protein
MNVTTRRAATFAALLAAPGLIALGAAGVSTADASVANHGPSVSAPSHHDAFPQQHNIPRPGTSVHHHHQHHEG